MENSINFISVGDWGLGNDTSYLIGDLIRDLIIEGLSLARTQKEEFASVIETNNGDVAKLFITLKEFIAK